MTESSSADEQSQCRAVLCRAHVPLLADTDQLPLFCSQGGGATSSGPAAGLGHEVILQGFNWESHRGLGWYKTLKEQVPDIAAAGFSAIWLPPPSESVSPQGCEHGQNPALNPGNAEPCFLYNDKNL